MDRPGLDTRWVAFKALAWLACLGLVTILYSLSLDVNGPAAGIPRSWAIAGCLALGHTALLMITYYWVTRLVYPAIVRQRWRAVSLHLIGIYPINALWTFYLYVLVAAAFLPTIPYQPWYQAQFDQAEAFASLTGISIFVPNWWLYSILVTAVSLKISRDVYLAKNEALQLEMNLLRSQINPHFLFNTLNNIYSLVEEKDAYAAEILLKFGDIMRYTLYENNANFIALRQEVVVLKEYIELEQIRYDSSARATIRFRESGDYDQAVIPPLLLMTLVENAFKHGTQAMAGGGWVDIRVHIDTQQVCFEVSNSKPLVPTTRLGKTKINVHRVGLANIRRRLELLYPENYTLTVADKLDTYTVALTLPKYATTPFLSGR